MIIHRPCLWTRARASPYSDADHSAITVFIDLTVEDSSSKRLTETSGLEGDLLDRFRELVPDLEPGKVSTLSLRLASQQLRDAVHPTFQPDIVEKMVRGSARDGREVAEGIASFQVCKIERQQLSARLHGLWEKRPLTSQHRRKVTALVLDSLTDSAPANARGKDVQVSTTLGTLISALTSEALRRSRIHQSQCAQRAG